MSEKAVLIIAGVMPIRLMAKQGKLVYDNKDSLGKVNAAKEAKDTVLDVWQHDWDHAEKGNRHVGSSDRYGRGLNAGMVKLTII